MRRLISNLFLAALYIGSWEVGKWYGKPKMPFCVARNNHVFEIQRISVSLVTDRGTGAQGFVPADPDDIRVLEKEISCPKQ